jgi:hypothetical protein
MTLPMVRLLTDNLLKTWVYLISVSGLYYKHIMIVIDAASVISK